MAGAIASDLRGKGEEKCVCPFAFLCAIVRCIRILCIFISLFVTHHLGCIVLHVVHT